MRKTKWEKYLSRKMRCASRAKDSFVETFFSARFLEAARIERWRTGGLGGKNNGERERGGGESDADSGPRIPECSSRSKRAFSFRRFASGSGRIRQDQAGSGFVRFVRFPRNFVDFIISRHTARP